MQTVAAYLLERREDMQWPEARASEAKHLQAVVTAWLRSKGALAVDGSGTYTPEDGSSGTFGIQDAIDESRSCWMLQLNEETPDGRRFSVSVSITAANDRVSVYITLETGWTTDHIMPVSVDARCPRIVRELLSLPGPWYHGTSRLRQRLLVNGFDAGEGLAAEIAHSSRTVPLIVVSTYGGNLVLPDLDTKLAHDLAGLANVVVVDQDGSWALTDNLGATFSCYWGAVRLYWPHFSMKQDRLVHPLWTRERLHSAGEDVIDTRERFRGQLRGILFRASALSVTRPREIDEIRDGASRRAVIALRQRASSLEEYEQLADSYSTDNDQLREERASLRSQIEELQGQVAKLEGDRQALIAHLRAAKALPAEAEATSSTEEIAPAVEGEDATEAPPSSGEIRFYKKVYSRPTHDVMVRAQDCGCNNWESAHAADKARKGIAKLENDNADWNMLQHCASCTGGGMWRVRW
jgi:outer membrane murein-binding lipoprotein Lpp